MRYLLAFLISFIFLFSPCLKAQKSDSLQDYLQTKKNISLKGMKTLRVWGIANLGIGIVGSMATEGSMQYFHQMNAFWGGANVLISSIAINSIKRQEMSHDFSRIELNQKKVERTLLLNAGLDMLFIGAGFGVLNAANNNIAQQDRMKGYGYSIILQGSSLLVFDAILYCLHRKNRKKKMERLLMLEKFYGN